MIDATTPKGPTERKYAQVRYTALGYGAGVVASIIE
jgi:hypothetical protein